MKIRHYRKADWFCFVTALLVIPSVAYGAFMTYYALQYYAYTHNLVVGDELLNDTVAKHPSLVSIHSFIEAENLPPELTVVSAYFRLGNIYRGTFNTYTPSLYERWITVFERMHAPIIFFTDHNDTFHRMVHLRRGFPKNYSQIYLIKRSDLWSFSILDTIKTLFENPKTPKFYPDTTNAEYSCVMHAKAELIQKVIETRLFRTKYIAWLDLGIYRHDVNEKHIFKLNVPFIWNKNKILFSQVRKFQDVLSEKDVFRTCAIWVSGAIFLGVPEMMYIYSSEYLRAVKHFLSMGLMASDQQIVYAMYAEGDFKPRVEIQAYPTHRIEDFYHLAYAMKDIHDTYLRSQSPLLHFLQAAL